MMKEQARLPTIDKFFLEQRLEESRRIVREAVGHAVKMLGESGAGEKEERRGNN